MTITLNAPCLIEELTLAAFRQLPAHQAVPAQPEGRLQAQVALMFALLRRIASRPELIAHGDRTAFYALLLGKAAGLSAADLIHLHYAALLHDIGQLTLPDELLKKDGPLTAEEYELVQSHSRAGAELLGPISFLEIPALWIAHHHERWDGAGYPYGLRGLFIPLGSRILAVADTFDALTSDHPYSVARDAEAALGLLQVIAGSQLDPELVEVFVELTPGLISVEDVGQCRTA